MTAVLIVLYVVGGSLELAGILSVAFDIRDDRRRAEAIAGRPPVRAGGSLRQFGRFSVNRQIEQREDPIGAARRDSRSAEQAQQRSGMRLAAEAREQRAALLEILSGGIGRRRVGVVLLVLGLMISVAGNVLSATQ